MRNQGFFPSALGETAASAEESNLGYGGAWGAVADTFDNYWWFFPIFWFLVGAGVAAMFARAVLEDSVRWKLHYVGVLCATHWFVAQCLPEALVPALFYQAAYFVAFRFATVPAQSPRPRRIRRPAFEPRPAP